MIMAEQIQTESQLIDNELVVKDAITELNKYIQTGNSLVAVDCEGVSLSRKGELTILSIATREKAYIFDVFKVGRAIFDSGLREILEDETQEKLMFDCRQDSDALWHQFNVKLAGVLDLQLLEIMHRRENSTAKSTKPSTNAKFGRSTHKRRSQFTDAVEKIYGFRRCLELYVDDAKLTEIKDKGKHLFEKNTIAWKIRPLPTTLIQYCKVDTIGMFKLYDKMADILSSVEKARLKIASNKYIKFYREKEERSYDDYETNGFLPIDVIQEKGTTSFPMADTTCTRCKRRFPRQEFSVTQLNKGEQKCRVCKEVKRLNDVQKNREDNWARQDDDDYVEFPECGRDHCFYWGCDCC
ncbi:piRNA biogenesis protein EXD1-like [Dendronephthya gigantea]|uniref:piRNA biogenesis protein EXD1-like n=1 Tax=Dendronephthya gigantea TaxID=151771 RepID=UPI00106DACCA|nr:piRNA biogenesis protein EXD1-like [Dendronephthya gigantea]